MTQPEGLLKNMPAQGLGKPHLTCVPYPLSLCPFLLVPDYLPVLQQGHM